ncbi:arabinofuranosidase catalytic domain-containing protein [Ancylobacter sp.]|uniref:arabinofuranosidase catalytic domain-containing protein n=1 Tax=Ancylobacter sp. TaxID=1872567 RepID=UPI003BAD06FA
MAAFGFALDLARRASSPPARPSLDAFAGTLYAAYGLARLVSSTSGPGVRVRRSSDGAEADIGFTFPGALDVGGLLAFAGSASAFVVTWYDQSGNGRHATQSVTASQPRLVNAGAVDIGPNGRPILVFSGAQSLGIAGAAGFARNAGNLTVAVVGMSSAPSLTTAFFTASRGGNLSWYRVGLLHTPTLNAVRLAVSATDADNPPVASRAYTMGAWERLIGRARFLDGALDIGVNGGSTSATLGTAVASVDSDSLVRIGISPNAGAPLAGQMSTLVLSRSALDVAALDAALQGIMP